jgi:16S rRNA (guanine527-N7)-methyltransferase
MELLLKYFPDLTTTQIDQFKRLPELYRDWNSKINVISRKDIDNLYERHVLHSLAIQKVITFKSGSLVMDVGTGGGFPGIPLAIVNPETRFLLVDSVGKKIKVVKDIALKLDLKNVETAHARVESLTIQADYVVSRAVAVLKTFTHWVENSIKPSDEQNLQRGIYYLKGGTLEQELNEFHGPFQINEIQEFFEEPFYREKKVVFLPF